MVEELVHEEVKENCNVDLIFKYTENTLEDSNKAINNLIPRLTSVIGFGGILLKFIADLPDFEYVFMFKSFACLTAFVAIGSAAVGLLYTSTGMVIIPEYLLEAEWYRAEDEYIKLFILRQWIDASNEIDIEKYKKKACLNLAIKFLVASLAIFSLSVIASTLN